MNGFNVGNTYEDFAKLMDTNEQSRKWAYDRARELGYNVGSSYEQFISLIGPKVQPATSAKPAAKPASSTVTTVKPQSTTTAATPARSQDNTTSTAKVEPTVKIGDTSPKPAAPKLTPVQQMGFQMGIDQIQQQANQTMQDFNTRMENIRKGNSLGHTTERVFNPNTGKWEQKFYTVTGEAVSTTLEQSRKNLEWRDQWEASTPEGRKHHEMRMQSDFEGRVGAAMDKFDPDNTAEAVWKQADDRTRAEQNKHNEEIWNSYAALGGGREMRMMHTGEMYESNMADHLRAHDLQRMADDAWNRLGKEKQQAITDDMYEALHNRYPQATDEQLREAATQLARQQSDRRMFELAVEKNAPQSATEYFFRKALGMNSILKLTEAFARSKAGTTGDWEARDVAEQRYEKQGHKVAGLAGSVVGFAFDPLTILSAGAGGATVKGAMWLGGKAAGEAAARKFATTLGGRLAAGAIGGAANFGTYEAGSEAVDQLRWGGKVDVNPETGHYEVGPYSTEAVAKQFGHGLLMGAATGTVAPLIGNVSDKLVRATESTAGKFGIRAGELGVGTVAEGTIFSAPEFVSTYSDYNGLINSLSDKNSPNYIADEQEREAKIEQLRKERGDAMMDVWTDNMAMMAGFKGQHLIKSAPRRIAELATTPRDRYGHEIRAGFETRLRSVLDGNRRDLALTDDEKRELREGGYEDLEALTQDYKTAKDNKEQMEGQHPNTTNPNRMLGVGEDAAIPYNRFIELMNDGSISEAARAKMYYYLTGNVLPMSTVIGSDVAEVKDADGNVTGYNVQSFGANGVITSRTFNSKKRADVEVNRINRQAELNGVDVGERYYDWKGDNQRMYEACQTVGSQLQAPANTLFELMKRKPEEMNATERKWAERIMEAYDKLGDQHSTAELRNDINKEFGVDVDKAIKKEPNRRSEQEQKAVAEYANRLFADVKRNQEEARSANGNQGGPNSQSAPDRIAGLLGLDGGAPDDPTSPTSPNDPQGKAWQRGHEADSQERRDIAMELGADDPNNPGYADRQEAWNGVVQRINEDAAYLAAQQRDQMRQMQHTDGSLHPATLKEKDENGNDKTVYIVEGNVNMTPDGTMVDPTTSDKSVVVYDPATGERKMIDPTADTGIMSLDEVVSADEIEADIQHGSEQYVQEQIDDAQGTVRVSPGQEITLPTGEQALVMAVGNDGEDITVRLADGTQTQVQRSELQRIADEAAAADYRQRHGIQEENDSDAEDNSQRGTADNQTTDNTNNSTQPQANGRIEGAPADYEEGMELSVRDDDGTEKPAMVMGRVKFENGKFVPDAKGNIVEYLLDGEVRHEHVDKLSDKVSSYLPARTPEAGVEPQGAETTSTSQPATDGGDVTPKQEQPAPVQPQQPAETNTETPVEPQTTTQPAQPVGNEPAQESFETRSNRIREWLSDANLEWAEGKTKDEIIAHFGNELQPIAVMPSGYLKYLGEDVTDNHVYSGMGYFIDHAVNHHDEEPVEEYLKIQDILSYPDEVKIDNSKGRPTLLFIKKYGKYNVEMISVGEDGKKVVLHKSFFHRKKMPHGTLPNVAIQELSAVERSAISPSSNEAGSSEVSTLGNSIAKLGNNSETASVEGEKVAEKVAIPMKNGEEDWLSVTPDRAHQYIFGGEAGLSRREGIDFLSAQMQAANAALAKAKGAAMPKIGTNIKKYNEAKAKRQQKIDEAQNALDYWKQVRDIQNEIQRKENEQQAALDAQLHDEAVRQAQADYEARKQAEAERKEVGNENPMPAITKKWNDAQKFDGVRDEIVLPNGEHVKGHYVLHESGASSPSHDPTTWKMTDGFPMDANDNSVNDRDYENDKDAQQVTENISKNYDQRALQTPVVVSQDGVVLSGNGRTMAGELAAKNNTDGAYVAYLTEYAPKFGFTSAQVKSMQHPRVSFVPDERMPYTAETFAKFNQQEMKSQNKTEQAVKLGKTVSDDTFRRIVNTINGYDTLGDFYADPKASLGAVYELHNAGILPQAQLAEMVDGARGQERLSALGREMLENMLIGKAFDSNPEVVRMLTAVPSMRQSVITALGELADNIALGKDWSLQDALAGAVKLCFDARQGGYQYGDIVSVYARQGVLFADPDQLQTVADFNNATMLMLADVLNDKRVTMLKTTIALYNSEARQSAAGQLDIFSGGVRSREDILRNVIKYINENGRSKELQAASAAAVERRKAESVQQNGTPPAGSAEGERNSTPADERGGRGDLGGTDQRQKSEASTIKDENGYPFVKAPDGTTDFGEVREDSGLTPAPIRLSEGYQDENGKGYGLAHIEANHGTQIREAGFSSVEEFVSYVAKNYDEDNIRVGKRRVNGNTTYLLQVSDEHDNTLFVELSHDGTYWNVNSAGIFRKGYSNKKETVAKTEPQQPNNAFSDGSSLSADAETALRSAEPNGKPTVSMGKGSEKSANDQTNNEKVADTGQDGLNGQSEPQAQKAIRVVKVGDFYEVYGDDADVASNVLGITATKRGPDSQAMAGFPKHALDTYLRKLIEAGYPVDIVENGKTVERVSPQANDVKPQEQGQQAEETPKEDYSITPAAYTTKRGKELNMYLVKFNHELTKDEQQAAKELAKADKGWWSREHGGFLMRNEDAAQKLAETIAKGGDAVEDAKPLSLKDMSSATDNAAMQEANDGIKVEQQPQTQPEYDYDREDDVHDNVLAQLRQSLTGGGIPSVKAIEKQIRDLRKRAKTIEDGLATASGDTVPKAFEALADLNGRRKAYEQFLSEVRKKLAETKRDDALAEHGVKLGDKVIYKGKEAIVHDADEQQVTLDTGLAPVLYEVADWGDVKLPENKTRGNAQRQTKEQPNKGQKAEQQTQSEEQSKQEKKKSKWVDDEDADRFEELRRRWRKKMGQLNMGVDPEKLAIGTEMAFYVIKHGARKFKDFCKQMIEALGEEVRPYLKAFYNGTRDLPEMAEYEKDLTPYEEVRKFDVLNFDKEGAKDIVATAEHVATEQKALQEAEQAKDKLKAQRNEERKEAEQQAGADTEAAASKGTAVASEVESKLPSARTEREVNDLDKRVDDALDEVNNQLALLGYYEADTSDPSQFNESYGYMRTAEKKAVKNVSQLCKTLIDELGIKDPEVYDAKGKKMPFVRANIAPAGGDVTMRITLDRKKGVELYMNFTLEPVDHRRAYSTNDDLKLTGIMFRPERGRDYLRANNFFEPNVTLQQMISGIRSVCREWLPQEDYVAMAKRVAAENAEKQNNKPAKGSKSKKKSVTSQQPTIPSLFDGLFDEEEQNDKNNGLQRNDELRPGGLQTDRDNQGEHIQRQGEGTPQGRASVDRGREERGDSRVPDGNAKPVRPRQQLNQRNNHAERGVDYAPKGTDERIDANIAAIELAHKITDEGRTATPSEMQVLRRFSGWGGLGKAFKEPDWQSRNPYYDRLRKLLSDDEWREAEMSRNSAYFTPAPVIDTMWDIARAFGFKGGNVLEGSAGIGNIIGLMPQDMSDRSHIHAVEIDSTTGTILSLLYPDAQTDIQGFEQTKIRNGSIDLAITNVPFVTGLHVNDTTGDKDLSRKFGDIHDFCIAKNVRKLKPGGIGIFITSNGTMDKSQKLRDWLVSEGDADVVGAFRMNNETFGGTSATSDIIVIRKRVNGEKSPMAIDVSKVGVERIGKIDASRYGGKDTERPIDYNQYFIDHPENMGGRMFLAGEKGDTYRPLSKGLYPASNISQKRLMENWVKRIGEEAQSAAATQPAAASQEADNESKVYEALGPDVKEGSMLVDKNGKLCIATYGEAVPIMSPQADKGKPQRTDAERLALFQNKKVKGHSKSECFMAYKRIKDAVRAVLDYQTQNDDDQGLKPLLQELNRAYDSFVNTYGHLNKNTAISFLKNDMDYSGIAALESFEEYNDQKGKRLVKYEKSDIFKQRVVEKEAEPHPTTVKDGVITSIYRSGRIDLGYIASELGQSEEAVKQAIIDEGLGFEDPVSGDAVVSYEYLSGNVREKLRQAQEQNEDGRFNGNIKALEKVLPMSIPAHLIEYSLGSSWLDPDLYEQYIEERTGIRVKARNIDGTWAVDAPNYGLNNEKNRMLGVKSDIVGKTVWGHELIIAAMKNTSVVVQKTEKHYDGTTETISDKEATRQCGEKIDEIRQDFKDWARGKMQQDPDMGKKYEERYNDQFNNYVPKRIPDTFVPKYFSGATHKITLRAHQAKAAIRGTTQNVLLAHEVGSGKTFTLITTAMEMRRLGTAHKPMVVVQNATVGQFVGSAKFLYPNAKILTIEDKDRNAEGRKAFYAKIKYNDWDMIVIPQSVLDMIPDSDERQLAFKQAKVAEKEQVLQQMAEADIDDPIMTRRAQKELDSLHDDMNEIAERITQKKRDGKKAEVARQNATVRAQEMLDRKVDDVEDFDDMGIDALLVDEAHEYKHLGFATAMQRGVKGVDSSYSKKCQGVYLKCQSVMGRTGGKNIIFATGTPISNTAAEIWTFMKYLMPEQMMKDYGIYYFDDFVRNFGDIAQMMEFNTSGKFVQNNRFKGYQNLPELVRIWSGVSDTVLSSEVSDLQAKIPELKGGKAQDVYMPQTRALRSVMKYVRAQLESFEKMSGREKKENSHIPVTMYSIANSAAVDPRLVMDNAEDDPHSKTNACVRETLKALDESKKYQGTVAIFADHYQNKHNGFNLFEDIKDKLVKAGIPEEQVVVIKPGMKVEAKTKIFDKVNAGQVRVVLGSTATLGTGVNMQERLYTLIHLDAPNRPMDYTQRMGRILRQGNRHKEWGIPVKVIRFGVEDSLDVTAYQRLKTKGAIADSIMHGKDLMANSMENRTLEEEEDQFGDTVAQLSGSEYALLKQQAERELRKYQGKKKQWEADQVYIHAQKPRLQGQIKAAQQRSKDAADALATLAKPHSQGIVVGKKQFANIDAMSDFIKDFNKKVKATEEDLRNNNGVNADHKLNVEVNGHTFQISLHLGKETETRQQSLFEVVKRKMTYSCPELSLSDVPVKGGLLRNALEDITQNVVTGNDFRERKESADNEAERLGKELAMVTSREGKPFEYGKELADAEAKVEDYTAKMKVELDEKQKKYAAIDAEVEEATGVEPDTEDDTALYRTSDEIDAEYPNWLDGTTTDSGKHSTQVAGTRKTYGHVGDWIEKHLDKGVRILDASSGMGLGTKDLRERGFNIEDVEPYQSEERKRENPATYSSYDQVEGKYDYIISNAVLNVIPDNWRRDVLHDMADRMKTGGRMFINTRKAGEEKAIKDKIELDSPQEVLVKRNGRIASYQRFFTPEELRDYVARELGEGYKVEIANEKNSGTKGLAAVVVTKERDTGKESAVAKRKMATQLSAKLNTPVHIVEDVEEITHANPAVESRRRKAKGWYDTNTGEANVVLPNNKSVEDVAATIAHETIAHKGLRELVGEERYDDFLDEVHDHLNADLKKEVDDEAGRTFMDDVTKNGDKAKSYEQHRRNATDELFGRMAEKPFDEMNGKERTLWQRLKAAVRRLLDKFLGTLKLPKWFEIGDNELRYMLWRSKEHLEHGKEHPIDVARDMVKREELGLTDEAVYNMGDKPETFRARQKRAVENKGTVMPGLNSAEVKVVDVPKHDFTGTGHDAINKARVWAEQNLVGLHTAHRIDGNTYEYNIDNDAVGKFLSSSSTLNSDNLGVHLAVLKKLPEVIDNSIEAEEHPDYKKVSGERRAENGVGDDKLLVHRMYGAVKIDGKLYRVKTTMHEHLSKGNAPHDYRVTKIELIISGSSTSNALNSSIGSHGLNSELEAHDLITGAKLLQNVEKAYDKGKYLLDESKKADEDTALYRDEGETDDIWNDQSMGMDERITAAATRLAANHREDKRLRNDAVRAIGGNLTNLHRAMSQQRKFDMTTVKRVADLARVLMTNGYISNPTQGEVKRLLSAVKNAAGRENIEPQVQKVMDIMVDNQLKNAEATLHQLEAIKGSKVDARGVEVQGQLDPAGQHTMRVFEEARAWEKTDIEEAIAEQVNRMGSDDASVADEAAQEYAGLQLAMQYAEKIKDSKTEEQKLQKEIKQANDEASERDRDTDAYRQYIASLEDAIRQNKIERADAYYELVGKLTDSLRESIANAQAFKEAEKLRIQEIQHNANSDMQGRPADEHYKPTFADKFVNNSFVQLPFMPLHTFEQMMRLFGNKSTNGEGYLYNRYMRGWVDARQKEIKGVRNKFAILDNKAAELFGGKVKNWGDLIRYVGKLPKATVSFWNGGEMKTQELSQGNLMYIYMVNKMLDGRMKLRKMGITEENVADIENTLDPRLIELADWLQDEFLVQTRNEYNETHKRMFGASMAAVEHYFPLKILANARADKPEDLDNPDKNDGISTATGSIIKRRRNALPLDITNADALNVILDHVAEMEHWNAFAELNRDLNTLRTYKRFRNQVQNMTTIYGSGKKLWKKFNDVCQILVGAYRPPRVPLDSVALNFAKGVTAAKVSFRIFTALKQFLSFPAYLPDARADYLLADIVNPAKAWKWCMENLPIFNERWNGRMAGDPRLLKSDMDWKMWRTRFMQIASRIGMSPNAFIDALTVAIGAHSMYRTRLARYLKYGYEQEAAERRANQDAEILYNQTQQSSEGPFVSPMQLDRTWYSVMFTVFRNSPMAYQRRLHQALRDFKNNRTRAQRERNIEFMKKQFERDGLDEAHAEAAARHNMRRLWPVVAVSVATFGCILQFFWNLGPYIPYLLFGDDKDEKSKMWDDVWAHTMFGWLEGFTGGDVISQGGEMAVTGDGNPAYLSKDMPLTSDAMNALQKFGSGQHMDAINDIVNIVVQSGIGVNPQSITDAVLAIMDACGDDPELAHEAAICVGRILQVPQSQLDKMYFDEVGLSGDEVSKYTPAQLAERYAKYKVKRGRFIAPWSWGDEERKEKYVDKADKAIKERTEGLAGKKVNDAYQQYEEVYQDMDKRVKAVVSDYKKSKIDSVEAAKRIAALQQDSNFATYSAFKQMDGVYDKIVGFYLGAKSPEEAALCQKAVVDYKTGMVNVLEAADTGTRTKAMNELTKTMQSFSTRYQAMQPKVQINR